MRAAVTEVLLFCGDLFVLGPCWWRSWWCWVGGGDGGVGWVEVVAVLGMGAGG